VATDSDNEVNRLLADDECGIDEMQYAGAIGFHVHVADGLTNPEFLWRTAFYQALDEVVLDMVHCEEDLPENAVHEVMRQVGDKFDPHTRDRLRDEFQEQLSDLIESNAEAGETETEEGGD
jgi:hypothetical protein